MQELRVLKEDSTKRKGRGGRSERQRDNWCFEKKRRKWWKKCRELFQDFGVKKADKHGGKKVSERRRRQPKIRWTSGNCGKWLFLLLIIAQSWECANAASAEAKGRSEPQARMWQDMEVKESIWKKTFPKKMRRKEGQARTGMQKEAQNVR